MKYECTFSHDKMLSFICEFDVIKHKYNICDKNLSNEYITAIKYEELQKPTNLEKHNYSDLIKDASVIYGDIQKASEYSLLCKKVLDKFVLQYMQIPGLGSLYNEHYMDFEWNMHSNLDFENHTNSYYRDHFIHQVRNLYMVFELLSDNIIYDNLSELLFGQNTSKISKYAYHNYNMWLKNIPHHQNSLFYDLQWSDKDKQAYFKRYVIFASLILACLFHDVGYPVAYYFSVKDRILDFIPTFHALISDSNFDFNYVNNLLEETILFQVVGKDEIKKRFDDNDHGAISAILLALYFYKTGKIHSLPIEQQTAIEIGVLAIYNHTLKFAYCEPADKKSKTPYYKMQFSLNPISYLLRLCDDCQEWDREYFEIREIPNLLFCPECKTPLQRSKIDYDEYIAMNDIKNKLKKQYKDKVLCYKYSCLCAKKEYTKRDDFVRRKLVNIKACNDVNVIFKSKAPDNYIEINFEYDNYKLLRLCVVQLSFTEYRCKEIQKLKKFVEKQSFSTGKNSYNNIFIKHNLTPNPMLLKMFILRDYMEVINKKDIKDIKAEYEKLINMVDQSADKGVYYSKILSEIDTISEKLINTYLNSIKEKAHCRIIKNNMVWYFQLMILEHCVIKKFDKKIINKYYLHIKRLIPFSEEDIRYELLIGALDQIKKTYIPHDTNQIGTDEYITYLAENQDTYRGIEYYCELDTPINVFSDKNDTDSQLLTYYTDLYLYEVLNEEYVICKYNNRK